MPKAVSPKAKIWFAHNGKRPAGASISNATPAPEANQRFS